MTRLSSANPRTYRIKHSISMRLKKLSPVFRPLFVDVVGSSLAGQGGGKKDGRGRFGQRCYDLAAGLRRKVLKDLEAPAAMRWQANAQSPRYHDNCKAPADDAKAAMRLSAVRWLDKKIYITGRRKSATQNTSASGYRFSICSNTRSEP
jgi:hypothetical protein